MPLAVTINGQSYTIPETGDTSWGANGTTIYQDLLNQIDSIHNVLIFDADNAGTGDTYTEVAAAVTQAAVAGGIVYFPAGTYKIGSTLTFPSNVTAWFADGAALSKLSTATVVFNGTLWAPRSQILSGFDPADVTYGAKVSPIYQEWQGLTAEDDYQVQMKVVRLASDVQTVVAAATTDIDFANGYRVRLTLGTNITSLTLSNARDGEPMVIKINQAGSFTISGWPANVIWGGGNGAPTITTGAGAVDVIAMMYYSDDTKFVADHRANYTT